MQKSKSVLMPRCESGYLQLQSKSWARRGRHYRRTLNVIPASPTIACRRSRAAPDSVKRFHCPGSDETRASAHEFISGALRRNLRGEASNSGTTSFSPCDSKLLKQEASIITASILRTRRYQSFRSAQSRPPLPRCSSGRTRWRPPHGQARRRRSTWPH